MRDVLAKAGLKASDMAAIGIAERRFKPTMPHAQAAAAMQRWELAVRQGTAT